MVDELYRWSWAWALCMAKRACKITMIFESLGTWSLVDLMETSLERFLVKDFASREHLQGSLHA
jgi:hypothetical protein